MVNDAGVGAVGDATGGAAGDATGDATGGAAGDAAGDVTGDATGDVADSARVDGAGDCAAIEDDGDTSCARTDAVGAATESGPPGGCIRASRGADTGTMLVAGDRTTSSPVTANTSTAANDPRRRQRNECCAARGVGITADVGRTPDGTLSNAVKMRRDAAMRPCASATRA